MIALYEDTTPQFGALHRLFSSTTLYDKENRIFRRTNERTNLTDMSTFVMHGTIFVTHI